MQFEDFELDLEQRALQVRGQRVALGARAFDVLALLARHRERLVTKDELLDEVWAGLVVEENNLQVQISGLRRLLGPKAIATVPGRGYRLVARPRSAGGPVAASTQPAAYPEARADPADRPGLAALAPSTASAAAPQVAAPAAPAVDSPPPPAAAGNSPALPAARGPLLGRERDTLALLQALAQHRLVTVVGPGGVGKTSVALDTAHAWQRQQPARELGPWWAELATLPPTTDVQALAQSLGSALGLKLGMVADAVSVLAQALRGQHGLLVLDNAEHLAPACAALLAKLLPQVPGLRCLVTSQVRLQLPEEQVVPLETLPVPEPDASPDEAWASAALQLLLQRARAGHPGLRISDVELPAAIQVCRHLDGLPLAIELAAARVRWMGAAAVADRLAERLNLLARRGPEAAGTAPARQQTLRATLAWSHSLLMPEEQRLLHLLSVFSGGFALGLAERAAALAWQWPVWEVLDVLGALVDKSWVQVDTPENPGAPGLAAEPRYRLLESARLYAAEMLQASGEKAAAQAAHAEAVAEMAERHLPHWLHGRHDAWYAIYLPEADNLRTAFGHALTQDDAALAARLFLALCWVLNNLDQVAEAALRADVLERRFGPRLQALPAPLAVPMLMGLSLARSTLGQDRSTAAAELAVQRSREPGVDSGTLAYALVQHAQGLLFAGDTAGARARVDEAAALLQGRPPSMLHATCETLLLMTAMYGGQAEIALAAAERALQLALHFGNRRLPAIIRANLCSLGLDLRQYGRVVEQAQALLDTLPALGAGVPRAVAGTNLMIALTQLGRLEEARSHLLATMAAAAPVGYLSALLGGARQLAQRSGDFETAARLAGKVKQLQAQGEVNAAYEADEQAHEESARQQAELAAALGPRLESLLAEGGAMDDVHLRALVAALATQPARA